MASLGNSQLISSGRVMYNSAFHCILVSINVSDNFCLCSYRIMVMIDGSWRTHLSLSNVPMFASVVSPRMILPRSEYAVAHPVRNERCPVFSDFRLANNNVGLKMTKRRKYLAHFAD